MNNKKGFTLIELLAVIVILAIVTVVGVTTILPYIQNAGQDAFKDEANYVIDASANAVSLIAIGSVTTNYTEITDGYCFTLKNLVDLGLWNKDANMVAASKTNNKYSGTVKVTKASSGNGYLYELKMTDGVKYLATKTTTGSITISSSKNDNSSCS